MGFEFEIKDIREHRTHASGAGRIRLDGVRIRSMLQTKAKGAPKIMGRSVTVVIGGAQMERSGLKIGGRVLIKTGKNGARGKFLVERAEDNDPRAVRLVRGGHNGVSACFSVPNSMLWQIQVASPVECPFEFVGGTGALIVTIPAAVLPKQR